MRKRSRQDAPPRREWTWYAWRPPFLDAAVDPVAEAEPVLAARHLAEVLDPARPFVPGPRPAQAIRQRRRGHAAERLLREHPVARNHRISQRPRSRKVQLPAGGESGGQAPFDAVDGRRTDVLNGEHGKPVGSVGALALEGPEAAFEQVVDTDAEDGQLRRRRASHPARPQLERVAALRAQLGIGQRDAAGDVSDQGEIVDVGRAKGLGRPPPERHPRAGW